MVGDAMIWPWSTNANNGKTGDQLDAERAELARQRAARRAAEAAAAEEEGDYATADAVRQAEEAWQRQNAANLQREQQANEYTVSDAFAEGWDQGAGNVRRFVGDTVSATTGTVFKLLPWWLWLVLLVAGAFILNQQTGGLLSSLVRRKKA